ncbi:MAG TPA: type IX secretion system sortase PorU, partial [Bacteroidia bacterium]
GKWYKISVTSDGIYKMDYSFLKRLGMRMDSLKTQNIRIYGNGGGQLPFANAGFRYDDLQENAIEVVDQNNNGNFDSTDYVLFYGQAQHRWQYDRIGKQFHHNLNIYSDTTYYFVTKDLGTGKRIVQQNSSSTSPTNIVSSFDDYQFHELEEINLLKSGRVWHGETFDIVNAYNFTFSFPDINTSSAVYAKVVCSARRDPPGTDFSWNLGNQSSSFNVAGVATTSLYGTYYTTNFDTIRWLPTSSSIPLNISKTTPSPAIGWLDYVEINARRNLNMNGSQIIFRDAVSADTGKVSQFIISNVTPSVQVWEVTDRINVKSQQVNNSGNTLDFTLPTDSIREFIAFNGQSFLFPKAEGQVPNQNLHAMTQSDLIIVTNPLFLQQANKLANYHSSHDNLTFSVATTQEIFNEYSSGSQDVSAIRDFVKMFYDRAADSTQLPKYLLLFGRGSYDLKSTINNTNYIPAYESYVSDSPTASYPSDDFYGMLDNNEGNWDVTPDVLDIGIGRLPVKSPSEAEYVVNKIMKYTSVPGTIETGNSCTSDVCYGLGDWINVVTFCADDEDNDSHIQYADMLAAKVNSLYKNYNIDKIYLDAYQQVSTPGGDRYPDANAALNHRVEKGCLIMNWTGHGG